MSHSKFTGIFKNLYGHKMYVYRRLLELECVICDRIQGKKSVGVPTFVCSPFFDRHFVSKASY